VKKKKKIDREKRGKMKYTGIMWCILLRSDEERRIMAAEADAIFKWSEENNHQLPAAHRVQLVSHLPIDVHQR
jgi:hypothetical protein